MAKDTNKPCSMLNGLKVACMRNYELLAKYLRREFEENQIEQIHRVSSFPLWFFLFGNIVLSWLNFKVKQRLPKPDVLPSVTAFRRASKSKSSLDLVVV